MNQPEKAMSSLETSMRTGELLIMEGLVRKEDVDRALSLQIKESDSPELKKPRLIGMLLCDLNLITPLDNYYILHKHNKLLTIESVLLSKKILSNQALTQIVNQSRQQDIPFISYLLKSGHVTTSQMQKLLFGLFHIPFRSISDFIFNEKDRATLTQVMDKQRSIEQKIIPLVVKDNTILFGITEPDNILVVRQLNEQFPQYRFKALFIPISGFSWFSKIIYGDSYLEKRLDEKPVDLSLLLNFNSTIKDPEMEKKSVWILYERYELLRRLIGKSRRGNFQDEFNLFIQKTHKQICREYQVDHIQYSLKKEGSNVSVVAFPIK
ncbi:MAG: hypothetical protein ABIJ59_15370 [Pseudomonadota bacterium]